MLPATTQNPGTLSTLQSSFKHFKHHTSSTKNSRHFMRATVGIEVPKESIEKYSNTAVIPFKFAQFCVSFAAFLSPTIKTHERIAHGIQAALSLIQLILLFMMFCEKVNCTVFPSSATLCF